jgi:hypothetical protein
VQGGHGWHGGRVTGFESVGRPGSI